MLKIRELIKETCQRAYRDIIEKEWKDIGGIQINVVNEEWNYFKQALHEVYAYGVRRVVNGRTESSEC